MVHHPSVCLSRSLALLLCLLAMLTGSLYGEPLDFGAKVFWDSQGTLRAPWLWGTAFAMGSRLHQEDLLPHLTVAWSYTSRYNLRHTPTSFL